MTDRPQRGPGETGAAPVPGGNPTGIDAYTPREIARRMHEAGVAKAELAIGPLFMLGTVAGVFLSFGALFFTVVMTGVADEPFGPARLLGGVAFSLGLVLVVVGGAEVFTGNAMIVMAFVDRRVTLRALLRNWVVVYTANLVGALAMVALVLAAGTYSLDGGAVGATAIRIAEGKLALSPLETFARAILCNALVCLAVWLTFAARDVTGKILAITFPITAFVTMGFEHSIANMFLIPAGLALGAEGSVGTAILQLLIATVGNMIGGAGGVALVYRAIYRGG
ncbi:formate/nitrite transporter family protein [Methylobrevis albus]|uniref:Formate/nitrite transporter family protein n=1 Tax=Methylobrevis albus TaxID=2793297 RepID=A0A931MY89_9HYPH|nr:formate/nitrite transporter family protein [Methylobrevis albus]MBH0238147.1 formate/nitrite transporter family protein [Methylobrevis albus]